MPRIVRPGDVNRTRYVPEGWEGRCPKCWAIVLTEPFDRNIGDETLYVVACPTPECDGRIPVSPPGVLSDAHLAAVSYLLPAER